MSTLAKLSMADLEAYDPHSAEAGRERRFCCPHCGNDKLRNAEHRSLSVNTENGYWKCHRCSAGGKLAGFGSNSFSEASPRRGNFNLRPFALPTSIPVPAGELWENTVVMNGRRFQTLSLEDPYCSDAVNYLQKRGIERDVAIRSGVRFSSQWYTAPALMFPLYDASGNLVAAQGRFLSPNVSPKAMTTGPVSQGVFGCVGAWSADPVMLTEAPIDALSLAACGFPALALCGKDLRTWLLPKLGLRCVMVALDADAPGDQAADQWISELRRYGADASRLRPEGGKDWNEMLTAHGQNVLTDWLSLHVLPTQGKPTGDAALIDPELRKSPAALLVLKTEQGGQCCRAILGHLDIQNGEPQSKEDLIDAMTGVGFVAQTVRDVIDALHLAGDISYSGSGYITSHGNIISKEAN